MWSYTDDPIRDAEAHDADLQAELDKLPVCSYCNQPIQDDYYFDINDEIICEDCLKENFRKRVDDYVE